MTNIGELLQRGGVWFNMPSNSPELFIKESIRAFHLPTGIDSAELISQTLEREALVSTCMGKGIALPHPKTLLSPKSSDSFIALAYPRFPMRWKSPDGHSVNAAFFIVSANQQEHLFALSSIAKLCAETTLQKLLHDQAGLAEILAAVF